MPKNQKSMFFSSTNKSIINKKRRKRFLLAHYERSAISTLMMNLPLQILPPQVAARNPFISQLFLGSPF